MENESSQLISEALEQFTSGKDKGAPFERDVLHALLQTRKNNPAEFQRLKARLESSGVPKRDFNDALKQQLEAEDKEAVFSCRGEVFFSPERIKELERKGFVCDPVKGITDIHPNLFAKHVLQTLNLRVADGERFFLYEHGVWRLLPDKKLHRMIFQMIEEEQSGVWRPAWESGYMATLSRLADHVPEFDTQKNYLNLEDGMFNTETFELEPHHPDFHSCIQNPIAFDPDADCPRFRQFLDEVFQGDSQLITTVQEIMGYCCTAETRAQLAFIFTGIGSNGKSVLLEIIEHLCGKQNVSHVAMNELGQPFARAELVGKLLNVSAENDLNQKGSSLAQFKLIAAGDPIKVENKFEKGFTYRPVCKLLYAMNELPNTFDKSLGFTRRLVIVPFRRVFQGDEVDKMLLDKLLRELPGIFNFAMEGLKRLRANDFEFSSSDAIKQAVYSYRSEQNPAITFVADFVASSNSSDRLGKNELFDRFQTWCKQQGETDFAFKTQRDRRIFWAAFRTALHEAGLPIPSEESSNGWRYFSGLTLLSEPKQKMTDLFNEKYEKSSPETAPDRSESQSDDPPSSLVRVTVGGRFERPAEPKSEERPFEEESEDDDEDLRLLGTEFEEAEREALENAFDFESIQFDLNYLPNRAFRGLDVNEWLDSKPEWFDFDDYRFVRTVSDSFEVVSLA